jgi:hypothetical protein
MQQVRKAVLFLTNGMFGNSMSSMQYVFLFRKISKHQYFSHFHEKLGAEEEEPIGDRCRASVCCGRKIINAVIQFSVNNLHVSRRPKKIVLMHVQLRINFLVVFEVGN